MIACVRTKWRVFLLSHFIFWWIKLRKIPIIYIFVFFLALYAVATAVYQVAVGIINFEIIFVFVISGVVSYIFIFFSPAYFNLKGDKYDGKHKQESENGWKDFHVQVSLTLKRKLTAIGIVLAFGVGYIPFIIFGSNQVIQMNSANYDKTDAVFEKVFYTDSEDSYAYRLAYRYYDANGVPHIYEGLSFSGEVAFREGADIHDYYDMDNPEIAVNVSTCILMFSAAVFFILLGILVACHYLKILENFACFLVGAIFFLFGGGLTASVFFAAGKDWTILFGGPAVYGFVVMTAISVLFFVYGLLLLSAKSKAKGRDK